jgi:biotin transport system substrate-specific component
MASHYPKTLAVQLNRMLWMQVAAVIVFAAITALTARITVMLPFTPVPITLQTLAVVLSGLVLGARNGAWAQLFYLSLIAVGLPLDANGVGPMAFFGPTAGYLVFWRLPLWPVGWLNGSLPKAGGKFVAAIAGILVIYLIGASWLALMLGSWQKAWLGGVVPFILFDLEQQYRRRCD